MYNVTSHVQCIRWLSYVRLTQRKDKEQKISKYLFFLFLYILQKHITSSPDYTVAEEDTPYGLYTGFLVHIEVCIYIDTVLISYL